MLRRLAAISLCLAIVLAAPERGESTRRPKYGGTLRVEIGAIVNSLDPSAPAASAEEAFAKDEIDALLYERRNPDGTFAGVAGSGSFRIAEWEPGKRAVLQANEDFREGRPFVDSIEILMGRGARDRLLDLDLDRADVVEVPPEEARRASERGARLSVSPPDELIALVFVPGRPVAEDAQAREALSRSIDRGAIVSFILQKEGEAAGGLLPQWSSGTAFLFSTAVDTSTAKNLWAQIGGSPKIVLGYDASDLLEQTIAERIVVNVREAGGAVTLSAAKQGAASDGVDIRFERLRMPSPRPRETLARFAAVLGPLAGTNADPLPAGAMPQQIYDAERAIVSTNRVVPLVWLPRVYGLSARVRDWKTPSPGEGWPFADVWLGDTQ